jgi:hypothetical protein
MTLGTMGFFCHSETLSCIASTIIFCCNLPHPAATVVCLLHMDLLSKQVKRFSQISFSLVQGPNPLSCKKKITKPSKAQKRVSYLIHIYFLKSQLKCLSLICLDRRFSSKCPRRKIFERGLVTQTSICCGWFSQFHQTWDCHVEMILRRNEVKPSWQRIPARGFFDYLVSI